MKKKSKIVVSMFLVLVMTAMLAVPASANTAINGQIPNGTRLHMMSNANRYECLYDPNPGSLTEHFVYTGPDATAEIPTHSFTWLREGNTSYGKIVSTSNTASVLSKSGAGYADMIAYGDGRCEAVNKGGSVFTFRLYGLTKYLERWPGGGTPPTGTCYVLWGGSGPSNANTQWYTLAF